MTTVTTVSWLHEADTICILLESNGIKTFVPDQGTVTMQPFYSALRHSAALEKEAAYLPLLRTPMEIY